MTRIRNLKISINGIWFGLFALYIIATYFANDILMPKTFNSVVLYAFLVYSVFAVICNFKIKITPIFWWEVICMAVALFAMTYSPEFLVFGGTYYLMIVNFFLVLILTQMPWTEARFNMVMKTFTASAAGLIVVLALTGNLKDSSESGRLGEDLTGNANILAVMLMVSAVYAIWLIVSSTQKTTRAFSLISLMIIYLGMFLSGGRKYIVIPVIFLYVLLMSKSNKNGKKYLVLNTLLVVGILALLYLLIMKIPFLYDSIGYRFDSFFAFFEDEQLADGSTIARSKMIEAGWEAWFEKPIIGHGFDSFKYYNATSVTGNFYYSHNNFIELLYNQGIVGFLSYYSFYIYLFVCALRAKGKSMYKGFVFGMVVLWLFFELFGISYTTTPTQIMLFLGLCSLQMFSFKEPRDIVIES